MRTALVLASFLGALIGPSLARADLVYEQCGPNGIGFIKAGSQRTCIFRPREAVAPQAEAGEAPAAAEQTAQGGSNANIDQSLNSADLSFREGDTKIGCQYVSLAIRYSTDYKGNNVASENQRQQLRQYASRCNLRY